MTENDTDEINRTTICERCGDEYKPYTALMDSLFGDIGIDKVEMERFCRSCRFEMIGESTTDRA